MVITAKYIHREKPERLKYKFRLMKLPLELADLNLIERLRDELRIALHQRKISNLNDLEVFCVEALPKEPVE